uniref:Uncharacterized protein n=1 Tax=Naja naja TaxID=35670 RepID=A0A8C6YHQ4_NAJNA
MRQGKRPFGTKKGEAEELEAVIDTGCSRYLIGLPIIEQLGIKTNPLKRPIRFEQVDGTLIGETPATQMTELIKMELGPHRELICFIVAPKMSESIILGLAWLDKWALMIKWEDGFRKILIAPGPLPLFHPLQNHQSA